MVYDNFIVGSAIRRLRTERHMSISKLAEAVERSPAHLNMVELGNRKISFDLLYALMTVFDTDANHVLGLSWEGEAAKPEAGKGDSVDAKLQKLRPEQRAYLTKLFFDILDGLVIFTKAKDQESRWEG